MPLDNRHKGLSNFFFFFNLLRFFFFFLDTVQLRIAVAVLSEVGLFLLISSLPPRPHRPESLLPSRRAVSAQENQPNVASSSLAVQGTARDYRRHSPRYAGVGKLQLDWSWLPALFMQQCTGESSKTVACHYAAVPHTLQKRKGSCCCSSVFAGQCRQGKATRLRQSQSATIRAIQSSGSQAGRYEESSSSFAQPVYSSAALQCRTQPSARRSSSEVRTNVSASIFVASRVTTLPPIDFYRS